MVASMVASSVIIVGDTGSGKSALIRTLAGKPFPETHQKSIGAEFISRTINKKKLHIWATPGDKQGVKSAFTQISTINKTIAGMVCVDLSKELNLASVEKHIARLHEKYPSLPITLLGTKTDLGVNADTQTKLQELADKEGYSFKTVCAKTGYNPDILFNEIAPAEEPIVDAKPIAPKTTLLDELLTLINQQTDSEFKEALLALHTELKIRHDKGKDLNNVTKTTEATISLLTSINQQHKDADDALESRIIAPETTKQLFQTYLNNCPYQSGLLSKLIKTVAVTGICAVAGLAVAAGICSGLGLVAVGSAAFLGGMGLLGSTAAFFHKNSLQKAIETVAKKGQDHHLDDTKPQGPSN